MGQPSGLSMTSPVFTGIQKRTTGSLDDERFESELGAWEHKQSQGGGGTGPCPQGPTMGINVYSPHNA